MFYHKSDAEAFNSMINSLTNIYERCLVHRLQAVQNRPGVRATLAEKFVEIFNWYEADLEEVHRIYEQHKVMFLASLSG